jgi:hypothetical protein
MACICRSRPAGECWYEVMPVDRHDSPAGQLLQIQKQDAASPCRSRPAGECWHEVMPLDRHDSPTPSVWLAHLPVIGLA